MPFLRVSLKTNFVLLGFCMHHQRKLVMFLRYDEGALCKSISAGEESHAELHGAVLNVKKGEKGLATEYKDSSSMTHEDCRENAEKTVQVLSVRLHVYLKTAKGRVSNQIQPKGSGERGYFVCHWMEGNLGGGPQGH